MKSAIKTISGDSEGIYKEKGSKFLGFAFPVDSEDAVKVRLESLKKSYFDARHHCYAYRLGDRQFRVRAFDDGEPNHSAGDPILGQIRSRDLTNVLVVVVRYFGGTKLGVGGLINAYKSAAEITLANATIVEKLITDRVQLSYRYEDTAEISRLINEFEAIVAHQDFGERCLVQLDVPTNFTRQLKERVELLQATGHLVSIT